MVDGLAANSVTWGGLEMTLTVPESALATQTVKTRFYTRLRGFEPQNGISTKSVGCLVRSNRRTESNAAGVLSAEQPVTR